MERLQKTTERIELTTTYVKDCLKEIGIHNLPVVDSYRSYSYKFDFSVYNWYHLSNEKESLEVVLKAMKKVGAKAVEQFKAIQ